MGHFLTEFDTDRADWLHNELVEQGFEVTKPPHTLFQAKKKGVCLTLYASGKMMVQGSGMDDFIRFYLEPEVLKTFTYGYNEVDKMARIGVDESGKGDFFGPLVVAGVYADEQKIDELVKIGVKDSKKLRDSTILKTAKRIKECCPHCIVRINPVRYNELYEKFSNLNHLLGWGHATVIETLVDKTGCTDILIDKFASEYVVENALKRKKKQVNLTQRTRGEQDVVVAAASIIARAGFVEAISQLEKKYGVTFPKGASQHVLTAGRKLVQEHGKGILAHVGKLHFKTTGEIISAAE
ncbi:MAG: Ribonuclease HIII [Chlamydiales bacterium]|nr:Ribonuclease HIII [Chlamydiales bacterium]MCH9635802.1 Ribonuclease HIII [Chlamydiales bacterium]MCH9703198.1 ribonuclease HIII [Chlamydiota bacterium]